MKTTHILLNVSGTHQQLPSLPSLRPVHLPSIPTPMEQSSITYKERADSADLAKQMGPILPLPVIVAAGVSSTLPQQASPRPQHLHLQGACNERAGAQ
jgi:hypothetical protein